MEKLSDSYWIRSLRVFPSSSAKKEIHTHTRTHCIYSAVYSYLYFVFLYEGVEEVEKKKAKVPSLRPAKGKPISKESWEGQSSAEGDSSVNRAWKTFSGRLPFQIRRPEIKRECVCVVCALLSDNAHIAHSAAIQTSRITTMNQFK